ncbi:MAG: hypothetical protein GY731_17250 [Gammaproteobacteria bacterium]|nr:hypothetical protein [Gammaproteobacteria bacterium]
MRAYRVVVKCAGARPGTVWGSRHGPADGAGLAPARDGRASTVTEAVHEVVGGGRSRGARVSRWTSEGAAFARHGWRMQKA